MKNLSSKPSSIKEFQAYINDVYGAKNEGRSTEYIYAYLFRNAAYLSRVIGEKGNPRTNFIKSFSWLFALSSKLGIDLEEAFLKKYPSICPYCLVKPCICIKTGKKPVEYIPEWKATEEINAKYNVYRAQYPNLPFEKAVGHINDLYPGNRQIWNATGPTFQFYRILEELGEIHEAYTGYISGNRRIENIGEEIADVFAWLASTWGICFPAMSLTDEFISYYYEYCPVCKNEACSCPDHGDRGERLVEIQQLLEFKEKIEEIIALAPEYKDKLEAVVSSLETVEETRSTTGAVRTVHQATSMLDDIANGLETVDESTKRVKSIIGTVIALADKFPWG